MLVIRRTKRQDINQLAKIYKRAYSRPKEGESWSLEKAKAILNFYFKQETFIGITAILDKKIVGAFFSYTKPWYDGNHLGEGELFVSPDYQNQKIGTKLFSQMMGIADKKKCVVHELIAYKGISRWYKKIGFKESGLKHMSCHIKEIIKKVK